MEYLDHTNFIPFQKCFVCLCVHVSISLSPCVQIKCPTFKNVDNVVHLLSHCKDVKIAERLSCILVKRKFWQVCG